MQVRHDFQMFSIYGENVSNNKKNTYMFHKINLCNMLTLFSIKSFKINLNIQE